MTPAGSPNTPEARARVEIDRQLEVAGWTLQHRDDMNLADAAAITVRKFKLHTGHGFVDYMLFLDGKTVGVCRGEIETTKKGQLGEAQTEMKGLHPPALKLRYRASLRGRLRSTSLQWPIGCGGAANAYLVLVGPSMGRAIGTQRPVNHPRMLGPGAMDDDWGDAHAPSPGDPKE